MPDTLSDGGYITGSYDIVVGGYAYTCDTFDHDLPYAQADAQDAAGLPKGGAFVKQKEKLSVKIKAMAGVPAPAAAGEFGQSNAFYQSFDGFPERWWVVTNRKISSANTGAAIRTYSADIVHHVNTPAA